MWAKEGVADLKMRKQTAPRHTLVLFLHRLSILQWLRVKMTRRQILKLELRRMQCFIAEPVVRMEQLIKELPIIKCRPVLYGGAYLQRIGGNYCLVSITLTKTFTQPHLAIQRSPNFHASTVSLLIIIFFYAVPTKLEVSLLDYRHSQFRIQISA